MDNKTITGEPTAVKQVEIGSWTIRAQITKDTNIGLHLEIRYEGSTRFDGWVWRE